MKENLAGYKILGRPSPFGVVISLSCELYDFWWEVIYFSYWGSLPNDKVVSLFSRYFCHWFPSTCLFLGFWVYSTWSLLTSWSCRLISFVKFQVFRYFFQIFFLSLSLSSPLWNFHYFYVGTLDGVSVFSEVPFTFFILFPFCSSK